MRNRLSRRFIIPPAVRAETIAKGKAKGYGDALSLEALEKEGWLRTRELSPRSSALARDLSEAVGGGEAEAIALALEIKERLFMDDLNGRKAAEFYRVETTTTLASCSSCSWSEPSRGSTTRRTSRITAPKAG
jgi:predicted nucleic acid-binding protein